MRLHQQPELALFICFGVIGGLGNGFGYATPIPVMAKWFPDKRGLAVGLAVGGYGAGSAIFGPLGGQLPDSRISAGAPPSRCWAGSSS